MKAQDTIPFPDELTHLNNTLQIIDTALIEAGEDVLRLDQEYRDAKKYMADYRNEMDSHEKLQNERFLEQTDRAGVFAVEVRKKMEKLKESLFLQELILLVMVMKKQKHFTLDDLGLHIIMKS